jgi:hypothetical protein
MNYDEQIPPPGTFTDFKTSKKSDLIGDCLHLFDDY